MNTEVSYEQPLNERVRTFLRIEHLFDFAEYHLARETSWDSRQSISTLLDINDLLARSDIKSELAKELERYSTTLSNLEMNPGVDHHRLDLVLQDINNYLGLLRDSSCQPGNTLRQDELISSIKQRSAIQGGACSFDLPNYHFWLNRPHNERLDFLNAWQDDLLIIKKSIKLTLLMLRNSSNPTKETALSGFFQQAMEANLSCQLIRVVLPDSATYYPEISGGKHRFTIRFMEQAATNQRPIQVEKDIEFELHCCIL